MKVDIFDFELDRSLIAKQPASPRDTSRLLDLSEEDKIADRRFYDRYSQQCTVLTIQNSP